MPYEAKQGDGESWVVVNSDTGDIKETHAPPEAEEKAKRQVKLLTAIEKDPGWDSEIDG